MVQLSHPYMPTGKNHSFDYMGLGQQIDVFAFSYAISVSHSLNTTLEYDAPKMCRVLLSAQENHAGALPWQPV